MPVDPKKLADFKSKREERRNAAKLRASLPSRAKSLEGTAKEKHINFVKERIAALQNTLAKLQPKVEVPKTITPEVKK